MKLLRKNILDEAMSLERESQRLVDRTNQFLLDVETREAELMSAAGLNSAHKSIAKIHDDDKVRRMFHESANSKAVLTADQVRKLCIRYRLRLLPSNRYRGPIEAVTGCKLSKFLDDIKDLDPMESASTRLFVMAPAQTFNLSVYKPVPDPVLFYRHDNGLYAVVHQWGNDFTIFRRILGALTSSAVAWRWFMFLSSVSITVAGAVALWPKHEALAVGVAIAGTIFTVVRTIVASSASESRLLFSDSAWNSRERTNSKLFWS